MTRGRLAGLRARLGALARPRRPEPLPVAFDRRRIYVLPTAFGAFFAALLAVMLLGALNYNNNPALLLALLLAGAGNTSLFAAHLQLSGLRVVAVDAGPVPAGTPITLRVHLRADPARPRRGLRLHVHDGGRSDPRGKSLVARDAGLRVCPELVKGPLHELGDSATGRKRTDPYACSGDAAIHLDDDLPLLEFGGRVEHRHRHTGSRKRAYLLADECPGNRVAVARIPAGDHHHAGKIDQSLWSAPLSHHSPSTPSCGGDG